MPLQEAPLLDNAIGREVSNWQRTELTTHRHSTPVFAVWLLSHSPWGLVASCRAIIFATHVHSCTRRPSLHCNLQSNAVSRKHWCRVLDSSRTPWHAPHNFHACKWLRLQLAGKAVKIDLKRTSAFTRLGGWTAREVAREMAAAARAAAWLRLIPTSSSLSLTGTRTRRAEARGGRGACTGRTSGAQACRAPRQGPLQCCGGTSTGNHMAFLAQLCMHATTSCKPDRCETAVCAPCCPIGSAGHSHWWRLPAGPLMPQAW